MKNFSFKGFLYSPLILASLVVLSCQPTSLSQLGEIHYMNTPCLDGGESSLHYSEDGSLYLSWIEYLSGDTSALMVSTWTGSNWAEPSVVSRGGDWFVNWADFPTLSSYSDGDVLLAHWLEKSAEGTYDYDVRIVQSIDGGENWSKSIVLHQDGVSAEHGFVSMQPYEEHLMVAWLDGRKTKKESTMEHAHAGSMTLRAALVDKNMEIVEDVEVDSRVCDCCQTSLTASEDGLILAYRDRSEEEIRDISLAHYRKGVWSQDHKLMEDGWHIAGCPVNGPSVDGLGQLVLAAWYTGVEGPEVRVSLSKDGGYHFDSFVSLDEGSPLGRVDTKVLSGNRFLVSWLEAKEKKAELIVVLLDEKLKVIDKKVIATLASSRISGFPRLESNRKDKAYVSWTSGDSLTRVEFAEIDL